MDIKEIKERYTDELIRIMTEPDKSGRGYICPICGAGTGKNGTGLTPVKGKAGYFHCFSAGCEFHGDILQLIGAVYHLPEIRDQIAKAGELLHTDLSGKEEWKQKNQRSRDYTERPNQEKEKTEHQPSADEFSKLEPEVRQYIESGVAAFTPDSPAAIYMQKRGIPYDLSVRYGLGYCPNYNRDGMYTPAVIIPTGPKSFTARSLTKNNKGEKARKLKAEERAGIFNIECLENPDAVTFIVEGEIDALSVIASGCQAISTGGGTSKRELIRILKEMSPCPDTLFVVLPDNDKTDDGRPNKQRGYAEGVKLYKELKEANIPVAFVDTSNPDRWPEQHKDVNDFLVGDREGCISYLQKIKIAREDKVLQRTSGYMQDFVNHLVGKSAPIPTGFPALDELLDGGLHPGFICIGAVSSLGKTTFLLNMADNLAMNGQDVLIFSLEMSRYELIAKIISKRTIEKCLQERKPINIAKSNYGISDYDRYKNYSSEERRIIQECMDEFSSVSAKNIYIHEGVGDMGAEDIKAKIARHIQRTKKTPVVMIDYLQILAPADAHSTDKQNTDRNVVAVKRISRDFNLPIIAVSSFNRESYELPVSMSSFKESGNIEFGADQLVALQYMGMDYIKGEKKEARQVRILALKEENKRLAASGKAVQIQLKLMKNRSGAKGDMGLLYYPMFNYYEDPETEKEELF